MNLTVKSAVAAVLAVGAAGAASAVDISTITPATNILYSSGSTAIDPVLTDYFIQTATPICVAGTIDVYSSTVTPKFTAIACTASNATTGIAAGTNIAIVKEDNGGSLFGAKFAPTTLLQYGRPDALRFQSSFPWVNFPRWRAHVLGGVVFDTIDRSSSIPASMPGFTLLACFGVVALVRGRRGSPLHPSRIVLPSVVGGAAGTVFVITIAYVAQRHLADFFPPLLVLALVGVQALALRPNRRVVTAVIAVCIVGTWIGFGLARVYQHNLRPGDPDWGRGTRTISSTR